MRERIISLRSLGIGPVIATERFPKRFPGDLNNGIDYGKIMKLIEDEAKANPEYRVGLRLNHVQGIGTFYYRSKLKERQFLNRIDRCLLKKKVDKTREIFNRI
jgi:hypothetical protein